MSETLVFPQLASGALSCLPLKRTTRARTILNDLPGGAEIRLSDPDHRSHLLDLRYTELSDAELATIEQFFLSCEGRLRSFTFCDPTGNLLRWSEALDKAPWTTDPLVTCQPQQAGITAVTNAGQDARGFRQKASVPPGYEVCLALEARSASQVEVTLAAELTASPIQVRSKAGGDWQLHWLSCKADVEEGTEFSVSVEGGATVEIRHVRLCAQRLPGAYRRTFEVPSIWPEARFDQDELVIETHGVDAHTTALCIRVHSQGTL